MGRNISYYVLDDRQIDRLSASSHIDDVINHEILMFHEFNEFPFWRSGIEFGQNVKAWNPMLELLIALDSTLNNQLKEPLSKIIHNDDDFIVFKESEVLQVWEGLKGISISNIESAMRDEELKHKIKSSNGYRMESIDNVEIIVLEFMEIFNAFYKAQQFTNQVLVKMD